MFKRPTLEYWWHYLFLLMLVVSGVLIACGSATEPTPEDIVKPPEDTPTLEPTFTPSPSFTDTPIATPTDTPTREPTPTPAPQAGLSGLIFDQSTNQPIAEAQVSAGAVSTTTDTDGRYTLTDLPPGQYVLSVIHPDYDPGLSNIFTVATGEEPIVDVALYEPDTSPYPEDPMLTNPLDPNGAPTADDAERLAREQGLTGDIVSIRATKLTGEYLVNYKIGDEIRAAVAEIDHDVWELTDGTSRKWWIIKVCGNLASPLSDEKPIPTPKPISLPPMAGVVVDELSVRACTSEECAEVGAVPRGQRVEVFGCLADHSWCEVSWSEGMSGWCTGQSLRQLAVAEAVPVVEAVLPTVTVVTGATGKIAFVSKRDDPDPQGCYRICNHEIYVMNPDGSDLTRLTNDPADDHFPTWSPDGRRIAFTREKDIYVMNADGSNQIRLTNANYLVLGLDWSLDGQRIIFSLSEGNPGIYVMNIDGSGLTRVTDGAWPAWSPNGQWFAFSPDTYGRLSVMSVDGSGLTNLSNYGIWPAWSPDGARIAFTNREIYVINADGSGLTHLTNLGDDAFPTWSPDGQQIAFASRGGGDWHIYVMNADGSNPMRLTSGSEPDWSP